MTLTRQHALSRRGFCLCCLSASAAAAGGGLLAPRKAAAELLGIEELINYEAMYVMDYGALVGYRLALKHPEQVTARQSGLIRTSA